MRSKVHATFVGVVEFVATRLADVSAASSWHSGVLKAVALTLGMVFASSGVLAQDMRISAEEAHGGASGATPPAAPPSEALVKALKHYQGERYAEAAVEFQRIVDGEAKDAPANVQKAQFFLAKSLYYLKFYQSALSLFDEITVAGKSHLHFDQTLQWLAQLATQLPEPAGISEKVGRYSIDQLSEFNQGKLSPIYNRLLHLMGRFKYDRGEFEEAASLFSRVDKSSDSFIEAKFFEGIAYVRLRRARPAIAAFRTIIETIENGDAKGVRDVDRMRNLAWLSLARVYYTSANRQSESGDSVADGRLLGNAAAAWTKVEQSSEYWLDALFEMSWAFFLADEYARALGNIHTLLSPYFTTAYYPEALVIKAVTFFVNCQIDNARAVVAKFHERYDPLQKQLTAELARYADNLQFYEFLQSVRQDSSVLPEGIRGIVVRALSDRQLLRHLEYVKFLDKEEKQLQGSPEVLRNSPVAGRIAQDIALARSFAIDQAGDLAKARYGRLVEELQALMNQIDAIDLELATYERGQLSAEVQEQQRAAARSKGGNVEVDEEHQVWPFRGEYWRDELGFYRQQVTNQCRR